MVLHQLCDMLNRQGFESAIVLFHGADNPPYQWACSNNSDLFDLDLMRTPLDMDDPAKSVRDFLDDGIMIYPDLIIGNPLGASRVVRYILYENKNYVSAGGGEYVLSFSKMYHSNPNSYLFKVFCDVGFHSQGAVHWIDRTLDLTYFGKGPGFTKCFRIPGSVLVTRTWPEDKEQLGALLRQCRYFFTWDSVTSTNVDAVICGAVPVLLHENQISRNDINLGELGAFPNVVLNDFLNKESVVFDGVEVDERIVAMNEKVSSFEKSWPQRVREFAVDVSKFFNF